MTPTCWSHCPPESQPASTRHVRNLTIPTHVALPCSRSSLGSPQGLLALLARRAEERLPEFLRPRPRWHYYNAWMRQRILAVLDAADGAAAAAAAPATAAAPAAADLPPPLSPPPGVQEDGGVAGGWGGCGGQLAWRAAVVDKLLAATDANDLDLMLQHPVLLLAQVS